MRTFYALNTFNEGDAAPAAPAAQPAAPAAQAPATPSGFSFEQAEEIANARAARAERNALAGFFRDQGLDEAQVTDAIKAYKAAQKAKEPDVAAIAKERDDYRAELEAFKQRDALAAKGIKTEFAGYVAFEAHKLMAADKTLDSFDKAVDKFMEDHPQYAAQKQAYRVKTSADHGQAGGDGGKSGKAARRAELEAGLKAMARRRT